MKKVSNEILKEMEMFFLRELFQNIPAVDIEFANIKKEHDARGIFHIKENEHFCRGDEDLEGYRQNQYIDLSGEYGFAVGYDTDDSWQDPMNHPVVNIQIDVSLQFDPVQLVMTLTHELCHYYCWYLGYDYRDDDRDFLRECKKRGIATSYDFIWVNKRWVRPAIYRCIGKELLERFEGRNAHE